MTYKGGQIQDFLAEWRQTVRKTKAECHQYILPLPYYLIVVSCTFISEVSVPASPQGNHRTLSQTEYMPVRPVSGVSAA